MPHALFRDFSQDILPAIESSQNFCTHQKLRILRDSAVSKSRAQKVSAHPAALFPHLTKGNFTLVLG
jgi:hypothetical protein